MKKTIIALSAQSCHGKSETLKNLLCLFCKSNVPTDKGDICTITEYVFKGNTYKIAVSSAGDPQCIPIDIN